ncbi:hypothetical protein, partial [Bacillus atrophaeus]|uniref:hypothetical protein n=1 Tax=Bacillus atrophaeus TaxID=1452 RepID=UPI000261A170
QDVKAMIEKPAAYTDSPKAENLLNQWEESVKKFVKVIPKNYKQMLLSIEEQKAAGLSEEEAIMYAFEANTKPAAKAKASADQKQAVAQ